MIQQRQEFIQNLVKDIQSKEKISNKYLVISIIIFFIFLILEIFLRPAVIHSWEFTHFLLYSFFIPGIIYFYFFSKPGDKLKFLF
ncbi:MAG: hypothetical protein KDK36_19220, partial [Leptospiraceae bacterium]|nr:hypothetical protein [Leptospiraceae bacterium]